MSAGSDAPAADIRLRVLGRLDLEVDGGDADRVLVQPRRLALFLYLALRRPGGFVGRDHLLGLFWPESPAGQARASLRQALRFLRRCLGSGRLPGRGDEVSVELAGLTCDALEFRRALGEGDLEAALSAYEGDLLPGFFMPDAPDAQRWLETERSHLRTEARRAALELSEAAAEAVDLNEAARHARRALELEPAHEPAARQLIRILAAMGDRAGAMAAYDELLHTVGRFERSMLDMVRAWLNGDWARAQEAVRVQADMAPGSIPNFQVAEEARRLNRLHEARELLLSLDPERGELRGWIHYWIELATVLHLLGDHEAELEAASDARRIHHDDPRALCLEINALVGLGRIEDLERRIEESLTLTGERLPRPGRWLHDTARELWAHGHEAAAARTLDRALEWFREHVDVDAGPGAGCDAAVQRDFGRALYDAQQWTAAEEIFRRLVEGAAPYDVQAITGHHGHLRGHLDEGFLAAIARHRGDEVETDRWRRCLQEMDRRFLYGADRLWLGILKLLDGDAAGAVSEIRRALSEGLPFGLHLHGDPNLGPLRENPRFRALVRPREV